MAVLGLRFCARAFSSCSERGPLFIAVRGPFTVAASLVAEPRLQTYRLSSCGSRASCSVACGIFLDQGSNPCPLNWQADSQPLRHQGSPRLLFYWKETEALPWSSRWVGSVKPGIWTLHPMFITSVPRGLGLPTADPRAKGPHHRHLP